MLAVGIGTVPRYNDAEGVNSKPFTFF